MPTAIITNLRYIETTPQITTTPLGEEATVNIEVDSFVATFSSGPVVDHEVWFRPEAIGNRVVHYESVTDYVLAVEALVREVIFAWSPSLEAADPHSQVQVNGGTDARIKILWAKDVDTSVLNDHIERLDAAVETFSISEPGPELPPVEETPEVMNLAVPADLPEFDTSPVLEEGVISEDPPA